MSWTQDELTIRKLFSFYRLIRFNFQIEDGIDRVAAAENESGAGGFDIGDLLGM